MPTYIFNGISLEYAEKTPVITLANSNIEEPTDVYVTFYLTNVLDQWSGVTWERTPTVFTSGLITASAGSITTFTKVASENYYAIPLDSNLYIYKATFTPPQNASEDVVITIPSSNVFSYSYTDVTGAVLNGQTGYVTYTTQTRTVNISNGDIATVTIDTQYDLSVSTPSINEGEGVTFALTTKGLAAGTTLPYEITGVDSLDILGGQTRGISCCGREEGAQHEEKRSLFGRFKKNKGEEVNADEHN